MTLAEIEKGMNSENLLYQCSAFHACIGRNDIPLEWLEKGVNNGKWDVRRHAFKACIGRSDVPLEWLEKGVNDYNYGVRCGAFKACTGRSDVPLEWLERGVNNEDWYVRWDAFEVCADRSDIPLEWWEKGVNDECCNVRAIVLKILFKACAGRSDIPLEWLEKGLDDIFWRVRTTVSKILFDQGYQFPLIRMIEPSDKVYKKCENGVIVVAEIPKTAQVRGSIGKKCRASEAVIVEVIPNGDGCVKAVSLWDERITYKVEDHIVIDDFDHSNEECSTGFHFFNTLEEARDYFI